MDQRKLHSLYSISAYSSFYVDRFNSGFVIDDIGNHLLIFTLYDLNTLLNSFSLDIVGNLMIRLNNAY